MAPYLALRHCKQAGCGELVKTGYCDTHKKATRKNQDKLRGSAASRGYNARWVAVRKRKLSRSPMCEVCKEYAATVVHHIIAIDTIEGKPLRFSMENLQSLCRDCHERVERERGKRWHG